MCILIFLEGLYHHPDKVSAPTYHFSLKNVNIIKRRELLQLGIKFRRGALLYYLSGKHCMHIIYQRTIKLIMSGMCIYSYRKSFHYYLAILAIFQGHLARHFCMHILFIFPTLFEYLNNKYITKVQQNISWNITVISEHVPCHLGA